MRPVAYRLLTFAALLVGLALFASCGDDPEPGPLSPAEARDLLDQIPAQTSAADQYRYEVRVDFHGLEASHFEGPESEELDIDPDALALVIEGGVDEPNSQAWIRFTMTGLGFGLDELGIDVGGPFEFEGIQDGDVSYTRFPFFAGLFGVEPDQWIRAGLGAAGVDPISSLGEEFQFEVDDVAALTGAVVGDITVIGREPIRGASTIHLRATLDTTLLPGLENAGDLDLWLSRGSVGELVTDVWIDDQGRLHKIEYTASIPEEEQGDFLPISDGSDLSDVTATMTLWLFDYGEPLALDLPAEELVVTEEDLFSGFGFGESDPILDEIFALLDDLAARYPEIAEDEATFLEAVGPELHAEFADFVDNALGGFGPYTEDDIAALRDLLARIEAVLDARQP